MRERRIDLVEHHVERTSERSDLRAVASGRDPDVRGAFGDAIGVGRHHLEWAQSTPNHEPHPTGEQQEHRERADDLDGEQAGQRRIDVVEWERDHHDVVATAARRRQETPIATAVLGGDGANCTEHE